MQIGEIPRNLRFNNPLKGDLNNPAQVQRNYLRLIQFADAFHACNLDFSV